MEQKINTIKTILYRTDVWTSSAANHAAAWVPQVLRSICPWGPLKCDNGKNGYTALTWTDCVQISQDGTSKLEDKI